MTLIRKVKGFANMKPATVTVYFTSDDRGETLSLMADNRQITVRFGDIIDIVAKERAKGYRNGHFIIDEGWGKKG